MKKTSGWQRIGVALTVAWVLFVSIFIAWQYFHGHSEEFLYCDADAFLDDACPKVHVGVTFVALFGPPLLAWIAAMVTIFVFKWIRAGFQDEQ
jgi:hypothetical protein